MIDAVQTLAHGINAHLDRQGSRAVRTRRGRRAMTRERQIAAHEFLNAIEVPSHIPPVAQSQILVLLKLARHRFDCGDADAGRSFVTWALQEIQNCKRGVS
jgi:hypothetical protein